MLKHLLVVAALPAALLIGSCSAARQGRPQPAAQDLEPKFVGNEVVAEVNDVTVYASDLSLEVTRLMQKLSSGGQREIPPEDEEKIKAAALQALIENELLSQEAQRQGFSATQQEVEEQLTVIAGQFPGPVAFEKALSLMGVTREDLRRDLQRGQAVKRMIESSIAPTVSVSSEEVRAYYDANPQLFLDPERVHARHIFLRISSDTTEQQKAEMRRSLEALRRRVLQGESFAALADQHSQDPNAGAGGDLGYLTRGTLTRDFEQAVFALKTGEISGVVKSVYGYHLIQAVEHLPAAKVGFERVRESLTGFLQKRKVDETVAAFSKELRAKARVRIPDAK